MSTLGSKSAETTLAVVDAGLTGSSSELVALCFPFDLPSEMNMFSFSEPIPRRVLFGGVVSSVAGGRLERFFGLDTGVIVGLGADDTLVGLANEVWVNAASRREFVDDDAKSSRSDCLQNANV